jgi:hypothetical protein
MITLVAIRKWIKPLIPIKFYTILFTALLIITILFLGLTASGYTLTKLVHLGQYLYNRLPVVEKVTLIPLPSETEERSFLTPIAPVSTNTSIHINDTPETNLLERYTKGMEPLVRLALGLDFFDCSLLGKIFRVVQVLTQFLLIIGCIYLLLKFRKSAEFLAFLIIGILTLLLCVTIVGFSSIMNATRFYQVALFFMAPGLVIGGSLLFKKYNQFILPGILIVYLLFTSGLVFELTKQPNIENIDIPYTHAFSAQRIDTAGVFTENDELVRNWITKNNAKPLYADLYSIYFLTNTEGPIKGIEYIPWNPLDINSTYYIFLRERNVGTNTLTYWTGVGTRKIVSYTDEILDFNKVLEGREILYQKGLARLYGPK